MKKQLLLLLFLSLFFLIIPETQVSVSISSTSPTIGERLTLKFIARTSDEITSIKISAEKTEFDFITESKLSISEKNGVKTFEKDFGISFFKTGEFVIGPFKISLLKEGAVLNDLTSNSIPVNVLSVLDKDDKDIKPLKDLSEINGNPLYLLKYLIAILIIVAIVYFIIFFLKRRKKGKEEITVPLLPPEEEFSNRIISLWGSDLLRAGKFKKFFLSLTESYKIFLSRSYNFNAGDLTTYEIMNDLKKHEEDKNICENFDRTFLISDLAKFAKYIPSDNEMEEIKKYLLSIIDTIRNRRKAEEEENNASL